MKIGDSMKVFLTSNLGCSKKINGIKYPKKMDNTNNFIEVFKDKLDKNRKFIFIASSPDEYERNDNYSEVTFESFKLDGFSFQENILIDHRYNGNLKDEIESSDLIFLAGGHTPTEMAYFEEIGLRDILKNYNGIIIGQSAGAINLATTVVCAPEYDGEIGTDYVWKGLGKTNINVEPHFVLNVPEEDLKIREELLKLSVDYPIYAICDGSYIFDDGEEATIYGEAYYINNRIIEQLSKNKETYKIKELKR